MEHLTAILTYLQTHALSVFIAIVVSLMIGFLWHGPLFGKQWMKYNKIPMPKKNEVSFSMMLPGFTASILMAFTQAAVLGRTFELVSLTGVTQAILIATILWLPFSALVLANEYTWAGKSYAHTAFDAAYNLLSIWAIGIVLYVMR